MSTLLRVAMERRRLSAEPGSTVTFTLEVTNTSAVIDGISARVLGVDAERVTSRPQVLSLFPDSSGQLTLSIELPESYPAGTHPLTVALDSHTSGATELVDVELTVSPVPRLQIKPRPAVVRTGRRAHFVVDVGNHGNVPLDIALTGADADRSLKLRFSRTSVSVPAGATKPVNLDSRAPRHLFGNDLDRPFSVHAEATAPATMPGTPPQIVVDNTGLVHRQRPVIARGVLTALILMTIVAMWAGAFLFGLTKVFGSDPVTKAAPASFFVATGVAGLAADSTPGDVLAKGGPLPAGVGGVISGRVVSTTSGDGIGRIVVEALRPSRTGLKLVTSSATQADGSYVVIGLFPGSYYLRFTAPGYQTTWYPGTPKETGAQLVPAAPQQVKKANTVKVLGFPATISGQVDFGNVTTPIRSTVIVRPLTGNSDAPIGKPVLTDAKGNYTLTGLPAPASYQVSFVSAGYLASTLTEDVGGGQHRYEPVVRLSAGAGTISGVVTDGHTQIGGVTVSTTVNGQTFTTGTPTVGNVGHFTLGGLPTPGLYILTFHRDASTSTTKDVTLAPGGSAVLKNVVLVGGTNAVLGKVVDANGNPVGGATITVGGTPTPITTTSLTGDAAMIGTYAITGVPVPGVYTLTISYPGDIPVTLPLTLDGAHAPNIPNAVMKSALGTITGLVQQPTASGPNPPLAPSVGATLTVTDGQHQRTTLTVDAGGGIPRGGYSVTGLAPGWYTITASRDGYSQVTALVYVTAGSPVAVPTLTLGALH
ncbi:MAG: carboxypeptidase regulatory-like domain-containing protein [Frankiaceae bacterium]|nr:carboxypeptidase regulatory-like domain-containing protein [Frankiaceae bacterium]MBV9369948.1 carboxypeptidase regulatory-like domain-containing protein [Frankiales bacterium]